MAAAGRLPAASGGGARGERGAKSGFSNGPFDVARCKRGISCCQGGVFGSLNHVVFRLGCQGQSSGLSAHAPFFPNNKKNPQTRKRNELEDGLEGKRTLGLKHLFARRVGGLCSRSGLPGPVPGRIYFPAKYSFQLGIGTTDSTDLQLEEISCC